MREALEILEESTPRHFDRFVAASALGAALAGQGMFEEAETFLLEGHEGLKRIPFAYYADEGPAAVERLVKLYELWGQKPDRVAAWQAKLADLQAIKAAMAKGDYSLLPE